MRPRRQQYKSPSKPIKCAVRQVETLLKPSNECKHCLERKKCIKERIETRETFNYIKFHRENGDWAIQPTNGAKNSMLTILDDKGRYALQVSVTINEREAQQKRGRAVGTAEPRPTRGTIHSSRQKRHEHSLVDATKVQGCKEEPEDQDIPLSDAKH